MFIVLLLLTNHCVRVKGSAKRTMSLMTNIMLCKQNITQENQQWQNRSNSFAEFRVCG